MVVLDLSESQLHGVGVGDEAVDVQQLATQASSQCVARPDVIQLKHKQHSVTFINIITIIFNLYIYIKRYPGVIPM